MKIQYFNNLYFIIKSIKLLTKKSQTSVRTLRTLKLKQENEKKNTLKK